MSRFKPNIFLTIVLLICAGCSKNTIDLQGYAEGEFTYMSSPVAGQLIKLLVKRGDSVTSKQELFILQPQPEISDLKAAEQQVKQAQADLSNLEKGQRPTEIAALEQEILRTKAQLVLSTKTHERDQELYKKGFVQKQILDQSYAKFQADEAQVKQAEANLATALLGARIDVIDAARAKLTAAQAELEKTKWLTQQKKMRSLVDAQVVDTYYKIGEQVPPNQPVLALLAPNDMKIVAFLPELLLSKIRLDENVELDCYSCQDHYKGFINYISPYAEYTQPLIYSNDNNAKLVFRIEIKPDLAIAKEFHPGQPVTVKLPVNN